MNSGNAILTHILRSGKVPNMILVGGEGVGKSSYINALLRRLYGDNNGNMFHIKLNASSSRGLKSIRERVVQFISTKSMLPCPFKTVIFEEADCMTDDAQFALRRIVESNLYDIRYIFISNNISPIDKALRSRMITIYFPKPSGELIKAIVKEHGLEWGMCDKLIEYRKRDIRSILKTLIFLRDNKRIMQDDLIFTSSCKNDRAMYYGISQKLI